MPQDAPAAVVAVGAVVVDREGRVLLVRRGRPPGLGSWTLAGGRLETGESLEEAVIREVEEETALRARVVCALGVVRIAREGFTYEIHEYLLEPRSVAQLRAVGRMKDGFCTHCGSRLCCVATSPQSADRLLHCDTENCSVSAHGERAEFVMATEQRSGRHGERCSSRCSQPRKRPPVPSDRRRFAGLSLRDARLAHVGADLFALRAVDGIVAEHAVLIAGDRETRRNGKACRDCLPRIGNQAVARQSRP